MSEQKSPSKSFKQVRAEQLEYNTRRESGRLERILKIYPWICGRCAREFDRKNLSELTVHHVDHNHDNNPGDGSNWELLCIYCHDEVCELALAHVNSDTTRAAYARSELLDKRRLLMQDWERFCQEGLPVRGKVIRIGNTE